MSAKDCQIVTILSSDYDFNNLKIYFFYHYLNRIIKNSYLCIAKRYLSEKPKKTNLNNNYYGLRN